MDLRLLGVLVVAGLVVAGCGGDGDAGSVPPAEGCADVVDVSVEPDGGGEFTFRVAVRSADTGWDKYADAWRIVGPGGAVLGTRELTHPHVEEQPFTRSLAAVAVPESVETVTVRARDSVLGFCGREATAEIPR